MSRGRILGAILAAIVGPALFWALMAKTGVTLTDVARLFASLKAAPALLVAAATALSTVLAGEKWRRVERALGGAAPSRRKAIALSAIGSALGQFLPPPLASAIARGGGNRLHAGEGGRRGALASVWEQLFDIGVICLLAVPAAIGLATRQAALFLVLAPVILLLADLAVAPAARLAGRWSPVTARLLEPGLCSALYRLSVARFVLLTVMTLGVALAIGSATPLAPLAAAIPLVATAATVSFLPGGLGVNEWSFVLILGIWGTPVATVVAFALMNRLLVASCALLFGAAALGAIDRGTGKAPAVKAFAR